MEDPAKPQPKKYKLPWELPGEASGNSPYETPKQPIQAEQDAISSLVTPTQPPEQSFVQQQPDIQPEKPKSKTKIIIIIVAIVGTLLLLGAGVVGFLIFQGVKDSSLVQQKVTSFLQYVSSSDLESAYKLTSDEFKQSTTFEDFNSETSLYKSQYSDFQKLDQTGFFIEAESGRPTTYKYSGTITYTEGDKGEVEAILIKEDGEYKLQYIYVTR